MLEWFLEIIKKFGAIILSVLPTSPFDKYLDQLNNLNYLGYLNWFIPVADLVKILLTWTAAVGVFYIYSIIMRWVKMIGD